MANNTIDTLSIDIKSNSTRASNGIGSLVENLGKLDTALAGFNSSGAVKGMAQVASSIGTLQASVSTLDTSKLTALASAMKTISASTGGEQTLSAFARSLANMPTNIDASGLQTLSDAIRAFGYKTATQATNNLPTMAMGLRSLSGINLQGFGDLTGLAELMSILTRVGAKKGTSAATNFQPIVDGLKQLSGLSGMSFPDGQTLLGLANAVSAFGRGSAEKAVQNMPNIAQAFKDLMTTLSSAPKVDASVVKLADALAKLSANGSKVGSATKSLGNALTNFSAKARSNSTSILNFGKNLLMSGKHATSTGSKYRSLASTIGLLYAKYWMLLRVVGIFNKIIANASHLTEVQNVVDTTFGKMSYKLDEFAKTSIKDFGMSELSVKQYASRFQAMGSAMGITGQQVSKATDLISSKTTAMGKAAGYDKASDSLADMSLNLTKLTADMASFYDVEQATVGKALQSGIYAGQTRPLTELVA